MSRFTLLKPASETSRLYKLFRRDDKNVVTREKETPGVYFNTEYRNFNGFAEMCGALDEIQEHGNCCIVRGDLSDAVEERALAGLKVRRTKFQKKDEPASMQPAVRDWVMIDIDKCEISEEDWPEIDPTANPENAIRYVLDRLPYYFRDTSCWWQFSSSQGVFPYRLIKVHLIFLLDRTVSDQTMRRWAESQQHVPGHLPIDASLFDCIQPHYIAPPRFEGLPDPLPRRSGVFQGNRDMVVFDVPEERDLPGEAHGNIHSLVQPKKLKPYLDQIGDDVGRLGFSEAIKSVVGRYFQLYGATAHDLPLKTLLRKAIEDAPKSHGRAMDGVGSPAHYASDEWLDPLIRAIRDKEVVEKQSQRAIYEDAIKRYVYVEEMERFLDLSTVTFRTKVGVTDTHRHELDKLSDILLSDANLRRVSRPTYKPGAPEFCFDIDPRTGREYRAYNQYTPSTLKPQNPKEAGWFVDHLFYILDRDEKAFDAVASWLAHLVQYPDEKLHFGILIQGAQGTGKSFISQIMSRVLGRQNTSEAVTPTQVMSPFNDWMQGKQLVTIEEIKDKDERFKIYDHMKDLITGSFVRINPKGLPAYDVPNRTNFIAYTNHEDAVPMDADDRRFIVHMSRAEPKPADYYADMARKTNMFAGAVLSYLQEYDLKAFDPKGRAPMTASKSEFLTNAGTPLGRWLRDSIEGEIWPTSMDLVTFRDLREVLPRAFNGVNDAAIAAVVRKLGGVELGTKPLPHGKIKVWAVRNAGKWEAATDAEIADAYRRPIREGHECRYVRPTSSKAYSEGDY